jgi:hypothetical protein
MKEPRRIPGLWWSPSNPNDRWIGTLTLEPGEMPRLDVTVPGGFDALLSKVPEPVIHGCDQHGKPVTLFFPGMPTGEHSQALSRISYFPPYAVLGIELPDTAAFQVQSLTLKMQHLYEWAGVTGFVPDVPAPLHESKIHYRHPEQREFAVNADLTIKLGLSHCFGVESKAKKIGEEAAFSFHCARGMSFQECQALIQALRSLLHFAVLSPVYAVEITAKKQDHGKHYGEKFVADEIELWASSNREWVKSELSPDRWVFRFADVESRFGQFFSDWLACKERFSEALECYFTTIYHPLPSVVEHLCLTQALEAFHGIKNQSHTVHDFLLKIRDLHDQFKIHLPQVLGGSNDFPETVRDNRNYYTHHNPRWLQDGRVVSSGDLFRLNEKLKLIFQMCILTEMRISPDRFMRLNRQLAAHIIDIS